MYLDGVGVTFDSPVGLLEAPRRGLPPATWVERLRRRRYAIPKRAPLGETLTPYQAVLTRPWQTQELAELLSSPEAEPGQCPVVLG